MFPFFLLSFIHFERSFLLLLLPWPSFVFFGGSGTGAFSFYPVASTAPVGALYILLFSCVVRESVYLITQRSDFSHNSLSAGSESPPNGEGKSHFIPKQITPEKRRKTGLKWGMSVIETRMTNTSGIKKGRCYLDLFFVRSPTRRRMKKGDLES